jgi:hypothetical protein
MLPSPPAPLRPSPALASPFPPPARPRAANPNTESSNNRRRLSGQSGHHGRGSVWLLSRPTAGWIWSCPHGRCDLRSLVHPRDLLARASSTHTSAASPARELLGSAITRAPAPTPAPAPALQKRFPGWRRRQARRRRPTRTPAPAADAAPLPSSPPSRTLSSPLILLSFSISTYWLPIGEQTELLFLQSRRSLLLSSVAKHPARRAMAAAETGASTVTDLMLKGACLCLLVWLGTATLVDSCWIGIRVERFSISVLSSLVFLEGMWQSLGIWFLTSSLARCWFRLLLHLLQFIFPLKDRVANGHELSFGLWDHLNPSQALMCKHLKWFSTIDSHKLPRG